MTSHDQLGHRHIDETEHIEMVHYIKPMAKYMTYPRPPTTLIHRT